MQNQGIPFITDPCMIETFEIAGRRFNGGLLSPLYIYIKLDLYMFDLYIYVDLIYIHMHSSWPV